MLSTESPNIIYLLHLVNSVSSQASTIVKDMSFGYLTRFPILEQQ